LGHKKTGNCNGGVAQGLGAVHVRGLFLKHKNPNASKDYRSKGGTTGRKKASRSKTAQSKAESFHKGLKKKKKRKNPKNTRRE